MDILNKITSGIKALAPVAADIMLPGSGRLLHTLMRKVAGSDEKTPIEQVAATIDADPQLFLELKRLSIESEVQMAQISAGKLETVNQTMREESRSEKWPQYSWRPFNGFCFPLAVLAIYFVLPICKATVPAVPEWVWMGWLAILGVATWDRGKEKRVKAGEQPAGLLEGAIRAIRGN